MASSKPINPIYLSIRPVVAFYTSPTFLLSKFLGTWFQQLSQFSGPHSIKNSTQLASEIKDMRFTLDCRLISFDEHSLFSCLFIEKAVHAMYKLLVKSGVDLDTANEFEKLFLLCTECNISKFDGEIFEFPGDLPFGGLMSSLIAEAFMDCLERCHLSLQLVWQSIWWFHPLVFLCG